MSIDLATNQGTLVPVNSSVIAAYDNLPEVHGGQGSQRHIGPNRPLVATGPDASTSTAGLEPVSGDVEAADADRAVENRRWTAALTDSGPARERAADELYGYLLRAARSELARRSDSSRLSGPERDDLTHQAAADALVSIIRRIPDFRGDSMFTTWARTFVTFEVRVKIRQHDRRSASQTLTAEEWDHLPSARSSSPEAEVEGVELKQAVVAAMATALTARQRFVFEGLVVEGSSIDHLATELECNRNAIYQLMFHARRNLRRHLASQGLLQGVPAT